LKLKMILFLLLIFSFGLNANLIVEYRSGLAPESIRTERFGEVEYFNIIEMNKAFKANVQEDILDQRINVNMYNEQIIFLIDSSLLMYKGEQYNFIHSIIHKEGNYFLPVSFLKNVLPDILSSRISFGNEKIMATNPVDNRLRTIVLDPGHGGKDPGAIGNSKKNFEKEVALSVVKKLKKKLEENLNVNVILTRDKDEFVSLQQRTQFANSHTANLFISIHCNAHRNVKVDGIEVYYLSTAKTDDARAVEALENQVVYDYEGGEEAVQRYDDLAFILADMAQSEHLEESYQLGMKLQNNLVGATGCHNRGVKQANFYVLRGAFMPAVLVELGFLSNKTEEKRLIKSTYQDKLVEAMFQGIKDFKFKYDQMQ
jgi:N-acetylmuramoyl-L-alanine amidase